MSNQKSSVSAKSSLVTVIVSAIFLAALLFIPFQIVDGKVTFMYQAVFGSDALLLNMQKLFMDKSMFPTIPEWVSNVMTPVYQITNYAMYGILAVDLVMGLLTLIFSKIALGNLFRGIARILSIIFGVLLIVMLVPPIFYIICVCVANYDQHTITATLQQLFMQYGLLPATAGIVVAIATAIFQFNWFRKGYEF